MRVGGVGVVLVLIWLALGRMPPLAWLGVTLLLGGGWLWIRPPRSSGGRGLEMALLALGLWMGAAFLPVPGSWRGGWWDEAFRLGLDRPLVHQAGRQLDRDLTKLGFDFELPPPATLQPWATAEALLYWPVAVAVVYGLGTLALAPAGRRRLIELLKVGGLVAAVAAWGWDGWRPDSSLVEAGNWPNPTGWGVAALMLLWWGPGRGGVAAPGLGWRAGALALLGLVATLLAGPLPVVGVVGAWLGEWAGRRWPRKWPGWSIGWGPVLLGSQLACGLVVLATAVLGAVGPIGPAQALNVRPLAMLEEPVAGVAGRGAVALDMAEMIVDQGLIGVGPGNVAALLPQYRQRSAGPLPVAHPRSDGLRLGAERGLPGLVVAGLVVVLALLRLRRLEQGEDPATRAPLAAGFVFLLGAGLWDEVWYTPGVALFGLLLYVLARPLRRPEWALTLHPVVWRGVGGVTLVLGLLAIASTALRLPLHSAVVLHPRPLSWAAEDNPPWPLERWHEHMAAVGIRPLSAREYFERARTRAAFGKFPRLLPVDLARARFLAPDRPELPIWEGVAWWPRNPEAAWAAWGRALIHPQADADRVVAVIRATVPDSAENRVRLERMVAQFGAAGGRP